MAAALTSGLRAPLRESPTQSRYPVADHQIEERPLTIITMAIFGVIAGFVLDELIARLAREPYERGEAGEDASQPTHRDGGGALELGSEAGALEMPRLLTTGAPYRRIVVIVATTAVFALLGRQYRGEDWHLAVVAFYASALIICTATDILAYRVPNTVTYPAIAGALLIGMLVPGTNRLDVAAGGLIFGGLLLIPSIITGGAMGMGDVKLAFFVGFALGLTFVVPAMLIMAMSGGLAAGVMLVTKLRGKGDPIPYAPFIAGGALVAMLIQGTAFYSIS
jgi:prepilin signal peptidase PulO-like enzyme (type II secretory pathway)